MVVALRKVHETLSKVHTTRDKVHGTLNKVHMTLYDMLRHFATLSINRCDTEVSHFDAQNKN
jgi:hypothetical protein